MNAPRAAHAALFVTVAVVLCATLIPIGAPARSYPPGLHLNWSFPVADMIRNWLLFIPLGAALRACGIRGRSALALGAGLSLGIEILQLAIPGRETAISDLLSNTLGTATGIALVRTAPAWIQTTGRQARRIAFATAASAIVGMAAPGWLLAPARVTPPLYAHHAPRMPNLEPYTGRVLEADLDGEAMPYGGLADPERVAARLRGDYTLRVVAEARRPADGQAALLLITDQKQREILLLGPDAEDLVLRFRNRGARLGLEFARIRVAGALRGLSDGERFRVEAERHGSDLCLNLDGRERCGLGFTLGDGWSLLLPDWRVLAHHRKLLGAIWLGVLLIPLGYWGEPSGSLAIAGALVLVTLLVAPAATGLLPTPPAQVAGAVGGVVVGRCLRWGLRATLGSEPA
jgi:VanZ family protein